MFQRKDKCCPLINNIYLLREGGEGRRDGRRKEESFWNWKDSSRRYEGPSFRKMIENVPALGGKIEPDKTKLQIFA